MNPLIGDSIAEFICNHLNQRLSLQIISDHFHFAEATLQKHFKQRYHKPVYQFIQEQRIFLSYKLLVSYTYPIKSIATMVGFKSSSAFSHFFRRNFNISPDEFRNTYHDVALLLF